MNAGAAPLERHLAFEGPLDLRAIARPLSSGFADPTQRVVEAGGEVGWLRAERTALGPATLCILHRPGSLRLVAYGAGAEAALESAPALLGLASDAPRPEGFPPRIRRLVRACEGLRLSCLEDWLPFLFLLVLQQKVSGKEAARSHRALVSIASEPAPGPFPALWLPPDPERVARLPDWAFAPLGLDARRGATLRNVGREAARLSGFGHLGAPGATSRLRALPGIGPWTVSSLELYAGGRPDAFPIGDLHLPSHVAWNLAGERRAGDERMLELLAPFSGRRGWVVRFIEHAGGVPPRRAPRSALRSLPANHRGALRELRRHLDG